MPIACKGFRHFIIMEKNVMNFEELGIRAVILDMDGVLWKSNQPLCDLSALFKKFTEHDLKFLFATNNAMSTVSQYINKFKSFGVTVKEEQIFTSGMATGYLMLKDFPNGGPVHVMGSKALEDTLRDYKFNNTDLDPMAVVGGFDPQVSYDRLKKASLLIQSGLPFYFTNIDATYPTPEGNAPGAGTFLAALETASGVKAKVAGKPEPYLYEACFQRLGTSPAETLAVGDRYETDILGGFRSGCRTALVLSGVASRSDLESFNSKPDFVMDDVVHLFD